MDACRHGSIVSIVSEEYALSLAHLLSEDAFMIDTAFSSNRAVHT